jgi:hypothetical protein
MVSMFADWPDETPVPRSRGLTPLIAAGLGVRPCFSGDFYASCLLDARGGTPYGLARARFA